MMQNVHKLWIRLIGVMFLTIGIPMAMSCALFRTVAKGVIDIALATCIEEHPEARTEPELAAFCEWAPDVAPHVRTLLAARAKGHARLAAQRDAGAFDAGDAGK